KAKAEYEASQVQVVAARLDRREATKWQTVDNLCHPPRWGYAPRVTSRAWQARLQDPTSYGNARKSSEKSLAVAASQSSGPTPKISCTVRNNEVCVQRVLLANPFFANGKS